MLEIKNLTKHYQNFTLNCHLQVKPGYITGLIGQNGAGKSTTFKACLGLIHPDEGEIKLFGKDISELNSQDKQKIGTVLANAGFSGYLTIHDLVPILRNLYDTFDSASFLSQCQMFELPFNKKIKDFSSGMSVKLKMLLALSHETNLLILDEPTAGLDVIARDNLLDMLRDYMAQDENRAILISSHISSDLESLCDDIYMIHNGQIILHEETNLLLDQYAVLKIEEKDWSTLDRRYLLKIKKENYGYKALTDQKQFYMENYPQIVIEKNSIDELMLLMIRGENK